MIEGGGGGTDVVFTEEYGDVGRQDGEQEEQQDGDFGDIEQVLVVEVVRGDDGGEDREGDDGTSDRFGPRTVLARQHAWSP